MSTFKTKNSLRQLRLKFPKKLKTMRLCQNLLVLIKEKSCTSARFTLQAVDCIAECDIRSEMLDKYHIVVANNKRLNRLSSNHKACLLHFAVSELRD